MASVERFTRENPDGSSTVRWRARYRDPAGRQRSRSFKRKVDAQRFLVKVETDVLQGAWTDPTLGRTTVSEWAPRWLASKRSLKPKTRHGYQSLLTSRVLPAFGTYPLAAIESRHVERWIGELEDEGLSSSRIRQCFNVLAAILDGAIRSGVIARNVARGVELPRTVPATRRFLSPIEVSRLANEIDDRYAALVLILGYSGIRFGEAVALRRRNCDLLRRQLRIVESATEVGGELSWGLPKTHRQRAVSLPKFVAEALSDHLDRFVPSTTDALVFTSDVDGPLRHGRFTRTFWKPSVAGADVPDGLTPHELRHTAASLLIASGAGPKSVQSQLGHSTITTTFDTYGHLFEGHLDDVMDRLDDDWRRQVG